MAQGFSGEKMNDLNIPAIQNRKDLFKLFEKIASEIFPGRWFTG